MLLEQITVEGALCSKASCVVLVEASRVAGERERDEVIWPDGGRGAQCWLMNIWELDPYEYSRYL